MKNILILKFPYSSNFGGGEKHTLTLTEELKKRDFKIYLLSSCPILLKEFKKRYWPAQKIKIPREPVTALTALAFPFWSPLYFIILTGYLIHYRLAKKVRIIYCLSLTDKILLTLPARILGIKVFWIEHVPFGAWLLKNPLRIFYQFMGRLAIIVTGSNYIKNQIEELGISPARTKLIYIGVDLDKFRLKTRTEGLKRNFLVGTIARLEKEKGLEYLIKAIKIVREFLPQIHLVIIGEGTQKQNLEWLTKQLDLQESVQFVGFQAQTGKWLLGFDIFVLPSAKREGLGVVLIEALACGLPAIASRIGGTPEIITHEKTGLLVPPGQAEELAQAILNLYNDWERALGFGQAGRELVERVFDQKIMIREYYNLFLRS